MISFLAKMGCAAAMLLLSVSAHAQSVAFASDAKHFYRLLTNKLERLELESGTVVAEYAIPVPKGKLGADPLMQIDDKSQTVGRYVIIKMYSRTTDDSRQVIFDTETKTLVQADNKAFASIRKVVSDQYAITGDEKEMALYEIASGKKVRTLYKDAEEKYYGLSEDGQLFAEINKGTCTFIQVATGKQLGSVRRPTGWNEEMGVAAEPIGGDRLHAYMKLGYYTEKYNRYIVDSKGLSWTPPGIGEEVENIAVPWKWLSGCERYLYKTTTNDTTLYWLYNPDYGYESAIYFDIEPYRMVGVPGTAEVFINQGTAKNIYITRMDLLQGKILSRFDALTGEKVPPEEIARLNNLALIIQQPAYTASMAELRKQSEAEEEEMQQERDLVKNPPAGFVNLVEQFPVLSLPWKFNNRSVSGPVITGNKYVTGTFALAKLAECETRVVLLVAHAYQDINGNHIDLKVKRFLKNGTEVPYSDDPANSWMTSWWTTSSFVEEVFLDVFREGNYIKGKGYKYTDNGMHKFPFTFSINLQSCD